MKNEFGVIVQIVRDLCRNGQREPRKNGVLLTS
jgi:hypothetical protein